MKDTISVIVPLYNVEKYIVQCLDSIIKQTYDKLDIVLIDDGSTDRSGEICDYYARKDDRVRVIHKINGGISSARNAGLDNAQGEYIAFVDSDDYIHRDMFSMLMSDLLSTGSDIACCRFFRDEKIDKMDKQWLNNMNTVCVYDKIQMFEKIYTRDYIDTIVLWNKVYKRQVFQNVRFPEGKIHEDEYVIHTILNNVNRVCMNERQLYFYRCRRGSTTRILDIGLLDRIEAVSRRMDYFEEKDLEGLFYLTALRLLNDIVRLSVYVKIHYKENKESLIWMEKLFKEKYISGKVLFKGIKEYGYNPKLMILKIVMIDCFHKIIM